MRAGDKMVGAKGFEPSTSWSRTSGQNHISRCPGVTYWFSGRSLMHKSRQATAEYWREPWGIDSKNGSMTPRLLAHLPWAHSPRLQQLHPFLLTTNVSNKSGNLLFAQS